MNTDDCRNELVLRERRGQLSSSERLALEAHLEICDSCRMTRLVGRDFDDFDAVDSADGERLARMMQASERWVNRPRRLAKPSRARWLLAAMATSLAAAATTVAVSSLHRAPPPPAEDALASARFAASTSRPSHPATLVAGAEPANDERMDDSTTPSSASVDAESKPKSIVPTVTPQERVATGVGPAAQSAEQLLQKANLARRNGETKEALRLFRRLQREYPSSREAGLSFVTLGTMLLEQGQAASALEQFNRYLGMGAGAALTAEALYGKGRALAQLGLADQEQLTWRRLLSEFPKSPYATHAKRRLAVAN